LGMPGMDGVEAARHIRGLPTGGNLLIVAVTGRGQAQDMMQTSAAGFDHHLLKPVESSALQALIAKAQRVRH
jgi:CheY-like chemotaxis protein